MNTILYPLLGTLFTFLMTTLGSALVFFFKDEVKSFYQQLFLGFAAGIMIAASVWSLLIPSQEMAEANGQNSALILGGGFIIGALFLLFLDHVIPHQHLNEDKPEGPKSMLGKNTMLVLAVTLHNIPEGFAVGLTFAIAASNSSITLASAFALALGIGLQNLPEGAAISLPLKQGGMSRTKAFVYGSLSGIVEPIAGVIAGFTIHIMQTILPVCLSFAAGAMASLIFDVTTTTSLLVILGQEIDLNIVAALLTIIGYSLNDTIVIYDRIRETLRRENPDSPRPLPEIIQEALGDTMSRTLLTAGTTLVAALALFLLGGPVIYGFALTMLIGVFMGTISSLFVAAPMLPLFGDTLSFKTAVTLGVFERPGEHGVV